MQRVQAYCNNNQAGDAFQQLRKCFMTRYIYNGEILSAQQVAHRVANLDQSQTRNFRSVSSRNTITLESVTSH